MPGAAMVDQKNREIAGDAHHHIHLDDKFDDHVALRASRLKPRGSSSVRDQNYIIIHCHLTSERRRTHRRRAK